MLDRYASDLLPDCNSHTVVFLFFWRTISHSFSSCYSHDVWLVYHILWKDEIFLVETWIEVS